MEVRGLCHSRIGEEPQTYRRTPRSSLTEPQSYRTTVRYLLREGRRKERARSETNASMLSGVGTPKSEFRLGDLKCIAEKT